MPRYRTSLPTLVLFPRPCTRARTGTRVCEASALRAPVPPFERDPARVCVYEFWLGMSRSLLSNEIFPLFLNLPSNQSEQILVSHPELSVLWPTFTTTITLLNERRVSFNVDRFIDRTSAKRIECVLCFCKFSAIYGKTEIQTSGWTSLFDGNR